MICKLLSIFVVFIFPAMAFADSSSGPCDFIDGQGLVALKLGEHKTSEEHKEESPGMGLPPQRIEVCNITPLNGSLPSLYISTVALSAGAQTTPPSCSWQSLSFGDLGVCTAFIKGKSVTYMLLTKGLSDNGMKEAFRGLGEHLIDKPQGPEAHGITK